MNNLFANGQNVLLLLKSFNKSNIRSFQIFPFDKFNTYQYTILFAPTFRLFPNLTKDNHYFLFPCLFHFIKMANLFIFHKLKITGANAHKSDIILFFPFIIRVRFQFIRRIPWIRLSITFNIFPFYFNVFWTVGIKATLTPFVSIANINWTKIFILNYYMIYISCCHPTWPMRIL